MSPPEGLLWNRLRGKQLAGLKFRRQHPVEPYVLDFYCAEVKLAVEVDGTVHMDEGQAAKDDHRDRFLAERGIRTLRIFARDVFKEMDAVLDRIAHEAKPR